MPLDPRNEGVYVTQVQRQGPAGQVALTQVERVNGDCTVTSIILTQIESVHVMDELRRLMMDSQ